MTEIQAKQDTTVDEMESTSVSDHPESICVTEDMRIMVGSYDVVFSSVCTLSIEDKGIDLPFQFCECVPADYRDIAAFLLRVANEKDPSNA